MSHADARAAQAAPLRTRPAWRALETHYQEVSGLHLRDLFAQDPERGQRLVAEAAELYLDFSKNRITEQTVGLLAALAEESGLVERREAMFDKGDASTLPRTARSSTWPCGCRAIARSIVEGTDVVRDVAEVLDRGIGASPERVRSGDWPGHTGEPIRAVVNIGIGGSDLGPVMAYEALRHYWRQGEIEPSLRLQHRRDRFRRGHPRPRPGPDPVHRLLEDLPRAQDDDRRSDRAPVGPRRPGRGRGSHREALRRRENRHREEVATFGIDTRTSTASGTGWAGATGSNSAIGLSTMLAIGPDQFGEMLAGFHVMDEHFREEPTELDLQALMGMFGVWYGDFFGTEPSPCCPTSSTSSAFGLPPAADHGEQRQACDPRRTAGGLRDRRRAPPPCLWGGTAGATYYSSSTRAQS